MRFAPLILSCWLGIGCAPRSPAASNDATAPVVSASSLSPAATSTSTGAPSLSPLQRVCLDATCGGPGAVVQRWLDAKGAVARWEIVDSPRCPHLAGLFYNRDGQDPVMLPLPFFPPGTPSQQQAVRSMHDAEIRGLTAGERHQCEP